MCSCMIAHRNSMQVIRVTILHTFYGTRMVLRIARKGVHRHTDVYTNIVEFHWSDALQQFELAKEERNFDRGRDF